MQVSDISKAAVCLHNFLKQEEDLIPSNVYRYCPPGYAEFGDNKGNFHVYSLRDDTLSCMQPVSTNSYGIAPISVHDLFSDFFNNEGALPWQLAVVTASN